MPLINYKEDTITNAIILNTIFISLMSVSAVLIHDIIEEDLPHLSRAMRYILTFILSIVFGILFFIILYILFGFGTGLMSI